MYVIWAYGPNDPPAGQDVGYHLDKRGTKSLRIIRDAVTEVKNEKAGDNIETFEIGLENVGPILGVSCQIYGFLIKSVVLGRIASSDHRIFHEGNSNSREFV